MEPTIELADWMTNKFFTQVLENIEKCSVELHKFDLKSGSAKGQNFASAIYRCKLIYTPEDTKEIKQKSLILKTNVTDPELKDLLNEFNVFQKEIAVYKNIFKEGGILLNSFGDTTIFGPKYVIKYIHINCLSHKIRLYLVCQCNCLRNFVLEIFSTVNYLFVICFTQIISA